ncbi:putative toxin-antitoxin system toxin component, PIN family [Candidatus Woesearchaeota archaeon]|nr:putative toxin-antitoxin system toxin component, PIN family [Candidatus Woesearchaeota archaeon]
MIRIVVDTNILISSIFWNGDPYKIVQLCLDSELQIIISNEIIAETTRVLKRDFHLEETEIHDILECIKSYATICKNIITIEKISRDPLDDHIIACATASKSDIIVTRDQDLLVLKEYFNIKIVTPEQFLQDFHVQK